MKWAKVVDNEVYNVGYLPRKFRGIPEPQLKENGWYRIEEDSTVVEPWQGSSSEYSYNQTEDKVTETKIITDISLDDWKAKKYAQYSKEAESYITNQYPLTVQLSAREGWYGEAKKVEILDWVKTHFDIILQLKQDVFNATTYEEVRDMYFRKNFAAEGEPDDWKLWGQ